MRNISCLIILSAIITLLPNNALGQGIHFSQFFSSPLSLNPALTGNIEGDWRIVSNYRSQGYEFGDPLNTISLSYDRPFMLRTNKAGIGIMYINDQSLSISLPVNELYVSSASSVQMSGTSYLSLGLQVGWVSKKLTYRGLSFPEQYDRGSGQYNPSLPMSENFDYSSSQYLDVNTGVLYNKVINNNMLSLGMAFYHINRPKDYFMQETNRLRMKVSGHGSFRYQIKNGLYVLPQAYYMEQNKESEFLFGTNLGINLSFSNPKFKSLSAGVYFRDGFNRDFESMIILAGFNYNNWNTIISYDIDMSGLKTSNVFSHAIELSVIYERPSTVLKKTAIPCIRY